MGLRSDTKSGGLRIVSDVAGMRDASNPAGSSIGAKLGINPGMVIWQIGFDEDCDDSVVASISAIDDVSVFDEDDLEDDVVDAVLLWWRDEDGDLVDALVDALMPLADNGVIWLMTPKPGRSGHVEPEDITDAAPTAGLQSTSTVSAGRDWQGTRLVAPRTRR